MSDAKVKTAYPDTYSLTKEYARENRSFQTVAEDYLWQHIRNKALGVRFRRQHIIGDYIADFVALEIKLIIEVDGAYHTTSSQKEIDTTRSNWLYKQGFYVLRFTNDQVMYDLSYVISKIKDIINKINCPEEILSK